MTVMMHSNRPFVTKDVNFKANMNLVKRDNKVMKDTVFTVKADTNTVTTNVVEINLLLCKNVTVTRKTRN